MKPPGTIAMYYSFLDDETRNIVELEMESARSFHDFIIRLVEWVCQESPSDDLLLLAPIHASPLYDYYDNHKNGSTTSDSNGVSPDWWRSGSSSHHTSSLLLEAIIE